MSLKTDILLPELRQELEFKRAARSLDGAPRWTIYDPIQHQFFEINQIGFDTLRLWSPGVNASEFLNNLNSQGIDTSDQELQELLVLLENQNLFKVQSANSGKFFTDKLAQLKKSKFSLLLHGYLFFKLPLIKPEPWLSQIATKLLWLRSPSVSVFFVYLGLFGLFQVYEKWDLFSSTFADFLNFQGFFIFLTALIILKVCHELGHAVASKWLGCRVGSMGVAFLVLFPILYTDTTDSWRLTQKKQRLSIVTAGLRVELKIAAAALSLWSILPPGFMQSLCFAIATTGVLSSLMINLTPFMRFDGYFAMSDILGMPNLQHRAFAIARWWLRQYVIGLKETKPEEFTRSFTFMLIVYSYLTWIYRFFLFLGIAIFVYKIDFKLLGLFLFVTEIWFFILKPISNEIIHWWENRQSYRLNITNGISFAAIFALLIWAFTPQLNTVRLPAVAQAFQNSSVFANESGWIEMHAVENQYLQEGDLIAQVVPFGLSSELKIAQLEYEQAKSRLNILQRTKLGRVEADSAGQLLLNKKDILSQLQERYSATYIRALHSGTWLSNLGLNAQQYINIKTPLGYINDRQSTTVISYANVFQKQVIEHKSRSYFKSNDGLSFPVTLADTISDIAESSISQPILTSQFNGRIEVRAKDQELIPEFSMFRLFAHNSQQWNVETQIQGTLIIDVAGEAPAMTFFRWGVTLLLAESGF